MAQNLTEDLNIVAKSNLEIELLDGDLNIIQKLDDEPNDVGGMTSAELKETFDKAGLLIQAYINEKLIPAILAEEATEAARTAAEQTRETNEAKRVQNEAARVEAESTRQTNEGTRGTQETKRATAEQARDNAEAARKDAEAGRKRVEEERAARENARATAEQGRVTAEAARKTAEEGRATEELERTSGETSRNNAEVARNSGEQTRISNENKRVEAESGRATAEAARVTAENARKDAEAGRKRVEEERAARENARIAAENARETSEEGRKSAEKQREAAEKARADSTTGIVAQATAQAEAAAQSEANAAASASKAEAAAARADKPTMTRITLGANSWSSDNGQTVTVEGILADETAQMITVAPAPNSRAAAVEAGMYCSAQGENALTFRCDTAPSADVEFVVSWQSANYAAPLITFSIEDNYGLGESSLVGIYRAEGGMTWAEWILSEYNTTTNVTWNILDDGIVSPNTGGEDLSLMLGPESGIYAKSGDVIAADAVYYIRFY